MKENNKPKDSIISSFPTELIAERGALNPTVKRDVDRATRGAQVVAIETLGSMRPLLFLSMLSM